jgi:hypothetical protein
MDDHGFAETRVEVTGVPHRTLVPRSSPLAVRHSLNTASSSALVGAFLLVHV